MGIRTSDCIRSCCILEGKVSALGMESFVSDTTSTSSWSEHDYFANLRWVQRQNIRSAEWTRGARWTMARIRTMAFVGLHKRALVCNPLLYILPTNGKAFWESQDTSSFFLSKVKINISYSCNISCSTEVSFLPHYTTNLKYNTS